MALHGVFKLKYMNKNVVSSLSYFGIVYILEEFSKNLRISKGDLL